MYNPELDFWPPTCSECEERASLKEDLQYWLKSLMGQLYGTDFFDDIHFENTLEEICQIAGIEISKRQLNVQRKQPLSVEDWEDWEDWGDWNKNYLLGVI